MPTSGLGVDLHRRRSLVVRLDDAGRLIEQQRIPNDRRLLAEAIGSAGPGAQVVLEATYGWYWAADVAAQSGAVVHLAHPLHDGLHLAVGQDRRARCAAAGRAAARRHPA